MITFNSTTHTGLDCVKKLFTSRLNCYGFKLAYLRSLNPFTNVSFTNVEIRKLGVLLPFPRSVRRINWVKGIIPLPFPHENRLYRKTCFPVTVYVRNSKQSTLQTWAGKSNIFYSFCKRKQLSLSISIFSAEDYAAYKEYYR